MLKSKICAQFVHKILSKRVQIKVVFFAECEVFFQFVHKKTDRRKNCRNKMLMLFPEYKWMTNMTEKPRNWLEIISKIFQ